MLILGIDTTAITASAAVAEFEGGLKKYSLFSVKNKLTHSENLLPMIKNALDMYGAKPEDIGLIAVSAGPGSFTGVRIGVSAAKGMAFARDIPCAGVSTLSALAENLSGFGGVICPVMDARREQFYNALFADGERLCADRAISGDIIAEELCGMGRDIIVCGDGAELFLETAIKVISPSKIKLAPFCSRDQNALSVAACGYRDFLAGKAKSASELKPIYLRPSQAERVLKEKEQG